MMRATTAGAKVIQVLFRLKYGVNCPPAGLVTRPIAFFTVVIVGSVTNGGYPAIILSLFIGGVIPALIVVLHGPVTVVKALLIQVLVVGPALLLVNGAL
jgi:hypothetical protein